MAFFVYDNLIGSPVTAIFDENGDQLFDTAGILSLAATKPNQFAEHTLENGEVVSDNKIEMQARITIQLILSSDDFKQVYQQIKDASEKSARLTIQTRVDSYDNMYIESFPYQEDSKIIDTIAININLIEQKFTKVKIDTLPPEKVKNKNNADTVKSGTKLPENASESSSSGNTGKTTAAKRISKWITEKVG